MQDKREFIEKFLNSDHYDFSNYLKYAEDIPSRKKEYWVDYINRHFSEEEKKKFFNKVSPFEKSPDKDDIEEKEELKTKIIELANKINTNEATLIDIVDLIGPSLNKYLYMLKLIKYTYKDPRLSATVVRANQLLFTDVTDYQRRHSLNLKYPMLDKNQEEVLREVITSRGLAVNDVTYRAAYRYALNNNLIQLDKEKIAKAFDKYIR